jgi:hypothetical protein
MKECSKCVDLKATSLGLKKLIGSHSPGLEYTRLTLKHPKDRTIEISFPTLCQYLKQECTLNNDQATKLGLAIMTRYGDESRVTTEEELEEDRDELADEAEAAAERRQYATPDRELPAVDELPAVKDLPLLSLATPNLVVAPTPKQSQEELQYSPEKGPPAGLFSQQSTGRRGSIGMRHRKARGAL